MRRRMFNSIYEARYISTRSLASLSLLKDDLNFTTIAGLSPAVAIERKVSDRLCSRISLPLVTYRGLPAGMSLLLHGIF